MKKSVRNLIMSWVGWGGLGWAGDGMEWAGVGRGWAGVGWGGLGWVGDGMGWCEAILDISQGFKEGRR